MENGKKPDTSTPIASPPPGVKEMMELQAKLQAAQQANMRHLAIVNRQKSVVRNSNMSGS